MPPTPGVILPAPAGCEQGRDTFDLKEPSPLWPGGSQAAESLSFLKPFCISRWGSSLVL